MTADKSGGARIHSVPEVQPIDYAVHAHSPLQIAVKDAAHASDHPDVVVVGVFAGGDLPATALAIEGTSKGMLSGLAKAGDLDARPGSTLMLYAVPGAAAQRLLLVSLGAREQFAQKAFTEALGGAAKALRNAVARNAVVSLADLDVPGRSLAWRVQHASRVLADGAYRFDAPKSRGNGHAPDKNKGPASDPAPGTNPPERGVRNVELLVPGEVDREIEAAARAGQAVAEGVALAKDLGNLPGNVCHPAYLADVARNLGKEFNFKVEVLERADMAKLGMYSALSVGRASDQPCKMILMHYRGAGAKAKPVVLVGKGVTFDTGGISLKPGEDLDMMKYDMCGGASVFGAVKAVARLGLPINLTGIVGAVENMPGGNASRPGDVVKSMSGQTIEILNTDAEGRLVLCDALTYAERLEPECVIDIATLTGACVIALGTQTTGLFANDETLADELFDCGTDTYDRAWRMPLFDEYQEQLKSNFADMSNLGGRPAGAVTAACFLSRFTKAYTWAHLDIAGTASIGGDAKGATGRPVPLLCEFLMRRAGRSVH